MCTCDSSSVHVTFHIEVESQLKTVVKGFLSSTERFVLRVARKQPEWKLLSKYVEGIKSSQHSTSPLLFPLHSLNPSTHLFFYLTNEGERVPTSP